MRGVAARDHDCASPRAGLLVSDPAAPFQLTTASLGRELVREIGERESVRKRCFPTPFLTPYDDKMVFLQDWMTRATRLIPAPNYVSYPRERMRFGHRQSLEAWQKRKENALRLEGHRAFFLKILPALFSFRFQSVPLSFAESPQQLPTPKRRSALMIADLIKSAYLQSSRATQSCGNPIL